ncbi:glycoside hydrolase family 5 protein [Saccharomonospora sp. NPDC046836]|uniref:glycoside hydrolase family 5 protein n=1 Tax=Saccharomonospora sp. NPDC046836 TaxID=3156921 RepID=UPI0033CE9F85
MVVTLAAFLTVSCGDSETEGLAVRDGQLVEANGSPFVIRGVNLAYAWYPDSMNSIAQAKELGANAVRVVLSSGDRWTRTTVDEVRSIVEECKRSRLICVLEVHDTTGFGEDPEAVPMARAVDYWLDIREALEGTEGNVIINIANEPFGNNNYLLWTEQTAQAIIQLRLAGFQHVLMVDAPNWGQDWTLIMRDNAWTVFKSDPHRNILFSVHMYEVFRDEAKVGDYLDSFADKALPIVIGEFGPEHRNGDPVDEDAIMMHARERRVGYFAWSWSGNNDDLKALDLVIDFDPARLTSWGTRLFNGPNGIRETAREATIYSAN